MICFSIETGPLPEDQVDKYFDSNLVKLGNITDPVKIERRVEAARLRWLDKAGQSPLTGEILAIGIMRDDGARHIYSRAENRTEEDVMASFWRLVNDPDLAAQKFVGFDSSKHDLPFLVRRSWVKHLSVPRTMVDVGDNFPSRYVDLHKRWKFGNENDWEKPQAIDKMLGGNGLDSEVDAEEFHRYWNGGPTERGKAMMYLSSKIDMIRRIAVGMGVQ